MGSCPNGRAQTRYATVGSEADRRREADPDYSPSSSEVECDRVKLMSTAASRQRTAVFSCLVATLPGLLWWPWGRGWAWRSPRLLAAVVTGSAAMAAEAAHSLGDTANDLFLLVAQRRSARPPDKRHPLGYGREAYFWALIAALGVFIAGAAFSLRQGITDLIHPSATSSFLVAYVVLGVSTVFDALSFRQSAHQMSVTARLANRSILDQATVTSDSNLRAVFSEDVVSVAGDCWLSLASASAN